jgi:NAD(P)-dependent dehydrogenase (short-subunit alcohol dehydrogenase family)
MTLPLAGKYAVITGASQGLGLAIAKAYVLAGANVMICARNKKKLADAHAELRALAKPDIQILAQTTDVTRASTAQKVVLKK